jgi:MFS family permease
LTLFLTLSTISLLSGGVILMTPFLFYEDKYNCTKLEVPYDSYKDCLEQICKYSLHDREKFLPEQLEIHSFASKFGDYRCPEEQAQLDLIKSFFYSGQLVAFFVASIIGDLFRTKIMVVGGLAIALVGIVIASFSQIFILSAIGLFLIPVGIITSYNLTYIFITEIVIESKRQTYKILVASLFSVGALTNVLWFLIVPDY